MMRHFFIVLFLFFIQISFANKGNPSPLVSQLNKRLHVKNDDRTRKITAAVLAFPLPFGVVGAHRIYLNSKPIVPISYIATVGGCFGIVPLIDFIVILKEPTTEKFEKNNKIFMWIK